MSANANALNNSKNAVSSWWSPATWFKTKPAAVLAPVVKANAAPVANAVKTNAAPVANAVKASNAPVANAVKTNTVPLAIGGSKKNYHRRGRTERRNRTRGKKTRSNKSKD